MRKTKIQVRKQRPAVKFTVRRIANKNPRNARVFHQFRRKLTRTTAGLIAFGLLASGMWIGDGSSLQSALLTSDTNSVCVATQITKQFENLDVSMANINRDFPKLFANLSFCEDRDCAAEKKIYQTEKQLWQLNSDIAELEKTTAKAHEDFTTELIAAEDGILFCENEDHCQIAEKALQTARICEKEFQKINQILEIRKSVEEKYTIINSNHKEYSASLYIGALMNDVSKNRDRVAENETAYTTCVAADDASVCQEYIQKKQEAEIKIATAIEELISLKSDFEINLQKIDADIVAIQLGKEDSENLTAQEGKGWCAIELEEGKTALSKKVAQAEGFKKTYESALTNLKTKKVELAEKIAAEIEITKMHAAAEKAASEKIIKAGTIFGIWNVIRNTF
jgi:hypothetical protein